MQDFSILQVVGKPLPGIGNTLLAMENGIKTKLSDILAENVDTALENQGQSHGRKGPSTRTVYNIRKKRHRPTLRSLEKLSRQLGIEVYQLLCPARDKNFLRVAQAYNEADDRDRQYLIDNAETILRRAGERRSKTGEALD